MKSFSRAIDRFCNKHRGFGIPRLMLFIVIITAVVFFVGGTGLLNFIRFIPPFVLRGEIWRLITWIFIPTGGGGGLGLGIFFTLIALYVSYMIGTTLEREWGTGKFTIFYLLGVLLHIIYAFIVWFAWSIIVPLTPIFLNLSLFFAFAVLFPDFTFRLFLIIPIKVKWLAILSAAIYLFTMVTGIFGALTGPPGQMLSGLFTALFPLIAIINFFLVCGDDLRALLQPLKAKTSPQVIRFKQETKKVKKDLADKSYRHKCAVCGKTDTEYPNVEFRYCSHCNGYHCFCEEHINSHIHFE
ncbi:MAG: rhomboid family intramembrane serine protease [Oscillospiraceae bacterium]|nr:rhomboid family intramembrane serine protease [Oscillospiraceae bacterium]